MSEMKCWIFIFYEFQNKAKTIRQHLAIFNTAYDAVQCGVCVYTSLCDTRKQWRYACSRRSRCDTPTLREWESSTSTSQAFLFFFCFPNVVESCGKSRSTRPEKLAMADHDTVGILSDYCLHLITPWPIQQSFSLCGWALWVNFKTCRKERKTRGRKTVGKAQHHLSCVEKKTIHLLAKNTFEHSYATISSQWLCARRGRALSPLVWFLSLQKY